MIPARMPMDYQVTIRYGKKSQRYLSLTVEASDVPGALRIAADGLPSEVVPDIDLVELRLAPDFDKTFPDQDGLQETGERGSTEDS